jgi:hypothetical protein
MLYYNDLENKVFEQPSTLSVDRLTIVSGYIGIEPIKKLAELPDDVHATVIYGMYGSDNISAPLHKALLEVQKQMHNVEILYSTIPVHSKIYLWKQGDKIKSALIGSANFSVSGLRNDFKEVLSDVEESSFHDFDSYYKYVRERCIPCTDNNIKVRNVSKVSRTSVQQQPLLARGICRASFLDNKGLVPKKSGLNWGCSGGHVKEGDAYIRITMDYVRMFPKMFPPKKYVDGIENINSTGRKNRENDEVELIWDDGTVMVGLLEGQNYNKIDGMVYPKQLSSSPQKSILGNYLRKRIGVSIDHVITKTDLRKYGRNNVDISLIGEGIYYMDFSVNK